jgi:hypothetical protein
MFTPGAVLTGREVFGVQPQIGTKLEKWKVESAKCKEKART